MSAVLPDSAPAPRQASPGLWVLAWRRLKADRVGMACLAVTVAFVALMLASFFGVVAGDWNKEKGVSYANPAFMAGAENLEAKAVTNRDFGTDAKPVDLSDIDPLAPRYKEWEERAAKIAVTEVKRAESLPFGGDKWGRDVLAKAVKGSEVSIFVGPHRRALRDDHRHGARRRGRLLGRQGQRRVLEWFYNIFTSIPYILLILAFAAVLQAGPGHDHRDPRAHRLDGHLPAGARRVHQALRARVREGRPGDRRLPRLAHVRAHPAEREST
jgi:oligopeptide transport system permease protein